MVGVAGLEPAASWSRTKHATICATPRRRRNVLYGFPWEMSSCFPCKTPPLVIQWAQFTQAVRILHAKEFDYG